MHIKEVTSKYFLLAVEIEDYNVMIDEKNFFDQLVKMIKSI